MSIKNFAEKQLNQETKRRVEDYTAGSKVHKFIKANCDCIVYTFTKQRDNKTLFMALVYQGAKRKPSYYYRFNNKEKRAEFIKGFFKRTLDRFESDEKYKIERQLSKKRLAENIKVGSILHGSWGYEQTNCELYQVVERPSKMKVVIRKIAAERIEGSESIDSCSLRPLKDEFIGEPLNRVISTYGVKLHEHCTMKPCNEKGKFYSSWGY